MKTAALCRFSALAGIYLAASPVTAQACTVCMGGDEITGEALNSAIFVMLGCIFSMIACIGGVAFSIWRRTKSLEAAGVQF